jgi:hypothetical protein
METLMNEPIRVPETMNTVGIGGGKGPAEALKLVTLPTPKPGSGQILVRVGASNRTNDNAPSHRVFVGRAEIGAAWPKRSTEGRDYLSVKLDDPSFNAPHLRQPVRCRGRRDLQSDLVALPPSEWRLSAPATTPRRIPPCGAFSLLRQPSLVIELYALAGHVSVSRDRIKCMALDRAA